MRASAWNLENPQEVCMNATLSPPATEHAPATMVGKYRVIRKLGEGAAGSVLHCADDGLGREVAVKILHPGRSGDPAVRERFTREARSLAQVSHPSVVQVFDIGECEQGPFFVMELVKGKNLLEVLSSEGRLAERRMLTLAYQAVLGLKAANALGLVHRDIKPANLLLSGTAQEERLKIVDFGIARLDLPNAQRLTMAQRVVGTPEYMSPEQARGETVDFRSDLYALGCTLFHVLTGQLAIAEADPVQTMAAQIMRPPTRPETIRADLHPATCKLLMRLLEKDPSSRFNSHDDLLEAINAARSALAPDISGPLATPAPAPQAPAATETLAICFLELLDFHERTRLQTREQNADWTTRYFDGVRKLVKKAGGTFIKQMQETVLFTFPGPTDAVLFALNAVTTTAGWSEGQPALLTYRIRVGVHVGEVRVLGGDVFGDPVNLASRVLGLGGPHEVLTSEAVHLSANRAEFLSEPLGPKDLKGIDVPVKIFKASARTKASDAAALNPSSESHGAAAAQAIRLESPGTIETQAASAPQSIRLDSPDTIESQAANAPQTISVESPDTSELFSAAYGKPLEVRLREHWQRVRAAAVMLATRAQPYLTKARARWDAAPRQTRLVGGGVAAGVLLVVVVAGVATRSRYSAEEAMYRDGRHAAVIQALGPRKAESPEAQLLYGKALMASQRTGDGLPQLAEALGHAPGLADDETLQLLLRALELPGPATRALIVKHFPQPARSPLEALVKDARFRVRHNAADALKELGHGADVDWTALATMDITTEKDCGRRKAGVTLLEESGASLGAVQELRKNPGDDRRCVEASLAAAETRIKKKERPQ